MMQRHPHDDLLLGHAAGRLDVGGALLVATHLELCGECARRVHTLEALGGVLLDDTQAEALADGALERTLARIDAPPAGAAPPRARARPDLPAGMHWPRSLRACEITGWHSIGPGMRWGRVHAPQGAGANIFLLRMAAGRKLAAHTHDGRELTQVLHGSFADGRAQWLPGDFDETDEAIHHRPVVDAGGECICLVAVDGRVRFDGVVARALGAWMGI